MKNNKSLWSRLKGWLKGWFYREKIDKLNLELWEIQGREFIHHSDLNRAKDKILQERNFIHMNMILEESKEGTPDEKIDITKLDTLCDEVLKDEVETIKRVTKLINDAKKREEVIIQKIEEYEK